jgi:hypothetical protein
MTTVGPAPLKAPFVFRRVLQGPGLGHLLLMVEECPDGEGGKFVCMHVLWSRKAWVGVHGLSAPRTLPALLSVA